MAGAITDYAVQRLIPVLAAACAAESANGDCLSVADTMLYRPNPNTNYEGAGLGIGTTAGSNFTRRGVMRFPCNDAGPTGAVVGSAILYIYVDTIIGVQTEARVHKMTAPHNEQWVEAQATWNSYSTGNAWTAAGGDYNAAMYVAFAPVGGWIAIDVTTLWNDAITNNHAILDLLFKYTTETDAVNRICSWQSRTGANPPYVVVTWTFSPAVPANYKTYVNVHRGAATVENGSWTVNGKVYRNRVLFTIATRDALPSGYPNPVKIDTKTLCATGVARYFGGTTAGYAKTPEFVLKVGADEITNTCGFWVESELGIPKYFNTSATPYWVSAPTSLLASTTYTFYMYVDALQTGASSNYGGSHVWAYFEDFDTNVAYSDVLATFLAAYPAFAVAYGAPHVGVSGSVLRVDSDSVSTLCDFTVATSSQRNYLALIKCTQYATWTEVGMFSADEQNGEYFHGSLGWVYRVTGADTTLGGGFGTLPSLAAITKYGISYGVVRILNSGDGLPNFGTAAPSLGTDVVGGHQFFIGTRNATRIDIDFIAVGPYVQFQPTIVFPNILYPASGTLFCNNNCQSWPYDLSFWGSDLSELYWSRDLQSELTKNPGDSFQAAVRVTDSLAVNVRIHAAFGKAGLVAPGDHCADASTFDTWDDFANDAAWTKPTGTWVIANDSNPVLRRGDVGNVGGGAGRLWARMGDVVKFNDGFFYKFSGLSKWEVMDSYWPTPYGTGISKGGTTPTAEFDPCRPLFDNAMVWGFGNAQVIAGVCYLTLCCYGTPATNNHVFMGVAWCNLANDPTNIANWTLNTSPMLYFDWLNAHGWNPGIIGWPVSWTLIYWTDAAHGPVGWYAIFDSQRAGTFYGAAFTTDAPNAWTAGSWTILGDMFGDFYGEECYIMSDGATHVYIFQAEVTTYGKPQRWSLDVAAHAFPGLMNWVDTGDVIITGEAQFSQGINNITAPAGLCLDGGTYYLYYRGQYGMDLATMVKRWLPNLVGVCSSATLSGAFTAQNLESKYHQTTNAASPQLAYVTGSNYHNFDLICEMIMEKDGGEMYAGVVFRGKSATDFYWAAFFFNALAPIVFLNISQNGAGYSLGNCDIPLPYGHPPNFDPMFYPGYTARLRVQATGGIIKVYYSLYGNPWVLAIDLTASPNYRFSEGFVGLMTYSSKAWYDKFRVRLLASTDAQVRSPSEPIDSIPSSTFGKIDGISRATLNKMDSEILAPV